MNRKPNVMLGIEESKLVVSDDLKTEGQSVSGSTGAKEEGKAKKQTTGGKTTTHQMVSSGPTQC